MDQQKPVLLPVGFHKIQGTTVTAVILKTASVVIQVIQVIQEATTTARVQAVVIVMALIYILAPRQIFGLNCWLPWSLCWVKERVKV